MLVDFAPFLMDITMICMKRALPLLTHSLSQYWNSLCSWKTQAYSYGVSQCGLEWNEAIRQCMLYGILKEMGTTATLRDPERLVDVKQIEVFGWFLFQDQYSIGVDMIIRALSHAFVFCESQVM